jgi:hypothetical protein
MCGLNLDIFFFHPLRQKMPAVQSATREESVDGYGPDPSGKSYVHSCQVGLMLVTPGGYERVLLEAY